MAFTGPATSPLLLVTDAGHDAVHVIDVVGRVHAGYVAAPGTIAGPRGVAARGSVVAVSAWEEWDSGDHVVCLFEGSKGSWTAVRVVAGGFGGPGGADGQLNGPLGLRLAGDGTGLVVADERNRRVTMFRVDDGSFVRHVATRLIYPWDVEECEGGWLVACGLSHAVKFVSDGAAGLALESLATGMGNSNLPLPLPWCLAWAWWCERQATVACSYLPPLTPLPWPPCLHGVWRGWWQWPGVLRVVTMLSARPCVANTLDERLHGSGV